MSDDLAHRDELGDHLSAMQETLDETEAERDAALAALDRVRALCDDAEASHRPYSRILDVNDVRAALDGPGE